MTVEIQPTEKSAAFKQVVARLLDAGHEPKDIAKGLHPVDKKQRKAARNALWEMLENDAELQTLIAGRAKARMVAALPKITAALVKRAERGRPDAIKLIFEASGFHNPRVKHDHTGNISITLNIPRPEEPQKPKPVANLEEENVMDADVVPED